MREMDQVPEIEKPRRLHFPERKVGPQEPGETRGRRFRVPDKEWSKTLQSVTKPRLLSWGQKFFRKKEHSTAEEKQAMLEELEGFTKHDPESGRRVARPEEIRQLHDLATRELNSQTRQERRAGKREPKATVTPPTREPQRAESAVEVQEVAVEEEQPPRPPIGARPTGPVGPEFIEDRLINLKLRYKDRPVRFASDVQVEQYFGIDRTEPAAQTQLTRKVGGHLDFHNAWAQRVEFINKDVIPNGYQNANKLDMKYYDEFFSDPGVADAMKALERKARELLEDAHNPKDQQHYVPVDQGDELSKYHKQANWEEMIFPEVTEEIKTKDQLNKEVGEARSQLTKEIWKYWGRFANFGKHLPVKEGEEDGFGPGGYEYQLRRNEAALAWARREGAPFVGVLENMLETLQERERQRFEAWKKNKQEGVGQISVEESDELKEFSTTDNILGWGDFFHEFPRLKLKTGTEEETKTRVEKLKAIIRGLVQEEKIQVNLEKLEDPDNDIKIIDKGREGIFIDFRNFLVNKKMRGSLEWLPFKDINWVALERGDKGAMSAWVQADGTDANDTRNFLFNRETGVAWHPLSLENAFKEVVGKKMWAHLAPGRGSGNQFEAQLELLDLISEQEIRQWPPKNTRQFKERAFKALKEGLLWGSLFKNYGLAMPEIVEGSPVDETKIAQLLLAVHDETTLGAIVERHKPEFLNWLRQLALRDENLLQDISRLVEKEIKRETLDQNEVEHLGWFKLISQLRFSSTVQFHQNIYLEPLKARVRWDERDDLFKARGELLRAIDNLTFKDDHALLFLTKDRLKELSEILRNQGESQYRERLKEFRDRLPEFRKLSGKRVVSSERLLAFLADAGKPIEHRFAYWPFQEAEHLPALEDLIATLDPQNPAIEKIEAALTPDNIRDLIIKAEQQGNLSPEEANRQLERFGFPRFQWGEYLPKTAEFLRNRQFLKFATHVTGLRYLINGWTLKEIAWEFWDPVEGLGEALNKYLGGALKIAPVIFPIPRFATLDVLGTIAWTLLGAAAGGFVGGLGGYVTGSYLTKGGFPGGIVRHLAKSKTAPHWFQVWTSNYDKKPELLDELTKLV